MKVGLMVGMVCAVMIACGDGERLREVEKQLSVAEEQLAAHKETAAAAATATAGYERTAAAATATARHRYECNMKIAASILLFARLTVERWSTFAAVQGVDEEAVEKRRGLIEEVDEPLLTEWAERAWPLIDRYWGSDEIEPIIEDLKTGRC